MRSSHEFTHTSATGLPHLEALLPDVVKTACGNYKSLAEIPGIARD
jgi:hypothetical protein